MKRYKCPCCGFYTFVSNFKDGPLFDYCEVCFWQFDGTSHDNPDRTSGANGVSLTEARSNYKEYGASKQKYKSKVREPFDEELPENN